MRVYACACVCVCVCVCVGVGVMCFALSHLRAWGLRITPLSPPRTRVSIGNDLDAKAMTELVPGLKTFSGLQTLDLSGAHSRAKN